MKRLKVLVTGGPVPGNLDAVKIITNKFKGGLMVKLAEKLAETCDVTYMTYKGAQMLRESCSIEHNAQTIIHNGFDDYRERVMAMSPNFDAVVLGGAVANLIPKNPWKGKFPSHDYQPGDTVSIDFIIAPRIIDEVKKVAPKTSLFGFKLLSNVDDAELVRAARGIVLESHATTVFGNDASNLDRILAVGREMGVQELNRDDLAATIIKLTRDEYYRSVEGAEYSLSDEQRATLHLLIDKGEETHADFFPEIEGMRLGCVATRSGDGFITTARGKDELAEFVRVDSVDHEARQVNYCGQRKPSLNAPLLDTIFKRVPACHHIVHGHVMVRPLPVLEYAPAGTVRDSVRVGLHWSFNVAGHGCYLMLDKNMNPIDG